MEILQPRYFFESAKNESFAKTAEKYMVPATSVSASVKRLEKELGCSLFSRSSNRIMLNENGKRLLQSLAVIFDELDQAVDSLTSISTDTREIRLLVRAMRDIITDHIIEYKRRHPHIAFKTVFDFEETDFENYDIIIDEKSDQYSDYESVDLYTTRLRLRAATDSPLCGKKLTLKQLTDQPFISIGHRNSMNRILIDACRQAGFTPNIVVQSNDLLCLRKCIEAGIGIGLSREYPQRKLSPTMKFLDVADFDVSQTICYYYKKQSTYGNVEHFLHFLESKALRK